MLYLKYSLSNMNAAKRRRGGLLEAAPSLMEEMQQQKCSPVCVPQRPVIRKGRRDTGFLLKRVCPWVPALCHCISCSSRFQTEVSPTLTERVRQWSLQDYMGDEGRCREDWKKGPSSGQAGRSSKRDCVSNPHPPSQDGRKENCLCRPRTLREALPMAEREPPRTAVQGFQAGLTALDLGYLSNLGLKRT